MNKQEIGALEIVKELSKTLPRFPDGRIDYSNSDVAPVVTIFVEYGNKILLLRRSDKVKLGVMPSWTDAVHFKKARLDCVVFGYGNLKLCHTPDEHLTLKEIQKQTEFFLKLFEELEKM